MNQAEIDHIEPRSKGGDNSSPNAQVLSKEENVKKGNKTNEFHQFLMLTFLQQSRYYSIIYQL